MPAAPSRVQELFLRAIAESDLAARAALIERECEPALRKRLNALLKAHDCTEAVVDRPAVGNSTILFNLANTSKYRTAQPGDMLAGRYRIIKQLGRGGMGVVFLAEQLDLHRQVALKMLTAGAFASPDELARFRGEAESLARLRHAGIVQVYDVGTHDGLPYLAMEYVAGGSLADSQRPFDPPVAARLVESLARAVQSAHGHGIVHRDLKPANVLLDETQGPKITDFGLAKLLDQQSELTRTGMVAGTPGYMSPEQASGQGAIGPAADIFALGAILYDLLTGRPPFQGSTPHETVLQTCSHEPPALSTLRSGLPHDLSTICSKCLEKDPRRRYATAGDLADDLGRFLRHEPVRARPVSNIERFVKWARRRPAVAASLASVVAISLVAFVAVFIAFLNARAAQQNEATQRQAAERSVYFGNIAQARLQWLFNDIHSSKGFLDKCSPELRGWEWHYMEGLHRSDLLTIPETTEPMVFDFDVADSGDHIVIASGNPFNGAKTGVIRMFETTGRPLWRREFTMPVAHAKFTGAGRFVVGCIGSQYRPGVGSLEVLDARTGERVRQLDGPKAVAPECLALSPNRKYLATAFGDRTIHFWTTDDWQKMPRQLKLESPIVSMSFSADNKWFVAGSSQSTEIWELPDWKPRGKLPYAGHCTKFSPVGALLAEVWNSNVRIRDLSHWTQGNLADVPIRFSFSHGALSIQNIAFSNDAKLLATASADGTVRTCDIERCVELNTYRGHVGQVTSVAFHPDGRKLVSADQHQGDVKFWDFTRVQDNALLPLFVGTNNSIECLGFDQSDDRLLGINRWGSLHAWDLKSNVLIELGSFDKSHDWLVPGASVSRSADGRRLAALTKEPANVVKIHDFADRRELGTIPCNHRVWHIAMDQIGNRIAVAAQGFKDGILHREVRVWDIGEQRFVYSETTTGEQVQALAISPSGSQLAISQRRPAATSDTPDYLQPIDQEVKLIDLTSLHSMKGPVFKALVQALAFNNAGTKLAIIDDDGRGAICTIAERLVTEQSISGTPGVASLAFNRSDTRVAGASRELVHLWDVQSGHNIMTLRGAPQRQSDNSFNPRIVWSHDGTRLAASNWDSSVSVWTGRPKER